MSELVFGKGGAVDALKKAFLVGVKRPELPSEILY